MMYPWHASTWQSLQTLRPRMPHALLLHGAQGIGKWQLAQHFAQSLLCEAQQIDGHPCASCPSCTWFLQYAHPDYRRVRPAALEENDENSEDRTEENSEENTDKKSAKTKASKEIRIEQIRALTRFIHISTHRHGLRVALIYPAEAMNTIAANGLLKMLEEPTPNTIFLLVAHKLDQLLPTILSRCQKLLVPIPKAHDAINWLQQQGFTQTQAHTMLAQHGGAPLTAQQQSSEEHEQIKQLLQWLMQPTIADGLKLAESAEKLSLRNWVVVLQRWLYDVFRYRFSRTVRYHPEHQEVIATISHKIPVPVLLQLLNKTNQRWQLATHPLSAKLFIESMLLEYSAAYSSA